MYLPPCQSSRTITRAANLVSQTSYVRGSQGQGVLQYARTNDVLKRCDHRDIVRSPEEAHLYASVEQGTEHGRGAEVERFVSTRAESRKLKL